MKEAKFKFDKLWIPACILLASVVGVNFPYLYFSWMAWSESQRLENQVEDVLKNWENPAPLIEDFEHGLSTAFWEFTIINGDGKASNETAWHAAEMVIDHQLTLRHVLDPAFETESAKWRCPRSWNVLRRVLHFYRCSNVKPARYGIE